MKTVSALLLAISVLLASTTWDADAYCAGGGAAAHGAPVLSELHDQPADQDRQNHAGHHCGHLAQHFLAQPAADLPLGETVASVRFEPLTAPYPISVSDAPIRPPRQRLS